MVIRNSTSHRLCSRYDLLTGNTPIGITEVAGGLHGWQADPLAVWLVGRSAQFKMSIHAATCVVGFTACFVLDWVLQSLNYGRSMSQPC